MKNFGRPTLLCVICFLSAVFVARGQSVPVETGSPVYIGYKPPTTNGSLNYAISAGVRETFGYTQQVPRITTGDISGNLGFITPSVRTPTSVLYTGGYVATTGPQPSAFFHDLSVNQDFNSRKWKVDLADQVRYLPDSPAAGINGLVGVGTTTGTSTTQGSLLPYATRIENTSNANLSLELTGKTALDATGLYSIERFPGSSGGIETNIYAISGGATHRVNALHSIGLSYMYSNFAYLGITGSFVSQGVTALYKRQLNRRLVLSLAGGPEYISASSLTNRPASWTYNADVTASYMGSLQHDLMFTASYKRLTDGGSGLTYGSTNDTVTGGVSTRITRSLSVDALGTYAHTSGLQLITAQQLNTQVIIGSVQANRAFTRTLSMYVSYTALNQSLQGTYGSGITPLIGLQQVLGFGVTYSPSPVHLGR